MSGRAAVPEPDELPYSTGAELLRESTGNYLCRDAGREGMADTASLVSALLMGTFLVAVVAALARGRRWRGYAPTTGEGRDLQSTLVGATESPLAWVLAFVVLALGFGGGAVLFVTSSAAVRGTIGLAMGLAFLAITAGYLLYGVYRSLRSRGRPSSEAAAAGAGVLGLLFVAAVALNLVLAG